MAGTHLLTFSLAIIDSPTRTDALASGGGGYAIRDNSIFVDGLNVGEVGHVYAGKLSLAASGTQDLDLVGALISTVGETINGSKLRAIVVRNLGPGVARVTRPAANGVPLFVTAADAIDLEEDDIFAFKSKTGKTITAATGDLINISESSTTAGVEVEIIMGIRGI